MIQVKEDANLKDVATEAYQQTKNHEDCRSAIVQWINENPEHFQRLHDEAVKILSMTLTNWAGNLHARLATRETKGVETTPRVPHSTTAGVLKASSIFLFVNMPAAGKRLGDCTRHDLIDAATQSRAKGAGHITKAIFMERLADSLKGKQTVAAKFKDNEVLRKLHEIAKNEADKKFSGSHELAIAGS